MAEIKTEITFSRMEFEEIIKEKIIKDGLATSEDRFDIDFSINPRYPSLISEITTTVTKK